VFKKPQNWKICIADFLHLNVHPTKLRYNIADFFPRQLKVAGSNPAGVANKCRHFLQSKETESSKKTALGTGWEDWPRGVNYDGDEATDVLNRADRN
jgi:hypothetical protein